MIMEVIIFGGLSILLSYRVLGMRAAMTVIPIRFLVPFLYFRYFHFPHWMEWDDGRYFSIQSYFASHGIGLHSSLLNWLPLFGLKGGTLFNPIGVVLMDIFGIGYSTNIFFFVFLSFSCVPFIGRMCAALGMSYSEARLFSIFFLLHPDSVAYSSFMDLRDPLIMAFTTMACCSYIAWKFNRKWIDFIAAALFLVFVGQLRVYTPPILLISFILALSMGYRIGGKNYRKNILRISVISFLSLVVFSYEWSIHQAIIREEVQRYPNAKIMMIYMISPLTWNIPNEPSFYWVTSIFHLSMLPLLVIGAVVVWKRYRDARVLPVIFVLFTVMYGLIAHQFSDPRNRYQLLLAYSFFQFVGAATLIRYIVREKFGQFSDSREDPPGSGLGSSGST